MKKHKLILILLLILLLQVVLRVPFLMEPLERDEGVYGYLAQTMLRGDVLYKDAIDNKPPVVFFIYAFVFKTLGQTILGLHLFSLFISLLTTLLLFLIASELISKKAGLISAFFYALFSGGPMVQGSSANTEVFVVFFVSLSLYLFVFAYKNGKEILYPVIGLIMGIAFMTKQVALFNFIVLLLFTFFATKNLRLKIKRISFLLFGFVLIPIFFLFYFVHHNALNDFIYNAFIYNFEYVKPMINPGLWGSWFNIFLNENSILWVFSISSIAYILTKERRFDGMLLSLWAIFSFFAVASGGFYFGHYYILVIPSLCLLSGYFLSRWENIVRESLPQVLLVVVVLVFSLYIIKHQHPYYLFYSPTQISISKYGMGNNFPNSVKVGKWIKDNSNQQDKLFMWGAQPEINFYAQRASVSRFFCAHPFYLNPKFNVEEGKREVYDQIKKERPRFIIWAWPPKSFPKLYKYTQENYRFIKDFEGWGVFEIKL